MGELNQIIKLIMDYIVKSRKPKFENSMSDIIIRKNLFVKSHISYSLEKKYSSDNLNEIYENYKMN